MIDKFFTYSFKLIFKSISSISNTFNHRHYTLQFSIQWLVPKSCFPHFSTWRIRVAFSMNSKLVKSGFLRNVDNDAPLIKYLRKRLMVFLPLMSGSKAIFFLRVAIKLKWMEFLLEVFILKCGQFHMSSTRFLYV